MGMVFGRIDVENAGFDVVSLSSRAAPTCPYEIRSYHQCVLAEAAMAGGEDLDRIGFRKLARYIGVFGEPQNEAAQPIAMTAPVLTDGDHHKMAFVMPAEHGSKGNISALPTPVDENVNLRIQPQRTMAVLRFSGTATRDVAATKVRELLVMLREDGVRVVGIDNDDEAGNASANDSTSGDTNGDSSSTIDDGIHTRVSWELARYNPPFTLPMFKTNEVLVPVNIDSTRAQ